MADLTEDLTEKKAEPAAETHQGRGSPPVPQWQERRSPNRRGRRWIFAGFVKKGVRYTIAFSCVIFAVYLAGSIPDTGFSDRMLFLLLRLLQYSSLLLCAFSLFSLGYQVRRMVYRPNLRNALGLAFYFATGVLGAGFAMINSMIIAVARGHG